MVRKRRLAAAFTLATSAASSVSIAHADSAPVTLYVSSASTACSDAGPGTQAQPYCALQAAVNAATAGDTILIGPGAVKPVTISNSGTAQAPITIGNAAGHVEASSAATDTTPFFTVSGASYVTIRNFISGESTSRMALITDSNHVTLTNIIGGIASAGSFANPDDTRLPGIEITGTSSNITLSRNMIDDFGRSAPSIQIDSGSTGDTVTTNGLEGGYPALTVNGAPDTDIVSNTIIASTGYACGAAITLTGASTGSYIENNVFEPDGLCDSSSTPTGLVSVASGSTTGTTVDYNVLNPNENFATGPGTVAGPDEYAYAWAGNYYRTVDAFTAATGQGAHDIIGAPGVAGAWSFALNGTASPAINSANSDAPGELSTDINGRPRSDDPLVPETGAGTYAYYDRGAGQIQPTSTTAITTQANATLGVTASSQHWSSTGYTVDFGDGTPAATAAHGTATHTYAKPGTYTITVTGTDFTSAAPFTDTTSFTTTAQGANILYQAGRNPWGWNSDGWQPPTGSTGIANAAITALPDGSTQYVAVTTSGQLEHNIYSSGAIWQGWRALTQPGVTVANASIAGMPNGSSQIIEVTTTGVLKHIIRNANGSWQSTGWGTPTGSMGIAQAAITALPDGSSQLVAVTTAGVLEHNIRNANGTWQGWRALTQPGVTVANASIAGMPNGSSQIIEATTTGVLKHIIRNANGSWQSGWGTPAGSTGIAQAAITALPDGSSQLVAVTTAGVLEHNIRNANGSWQGWRAPAQTTAVAAVGSAAIAGLPSGSSYLIEISAN